MSQRSSPVFEFGDDEFSTLSSQQQSSGVSQSSLQPQNPLPQTLENAFAHLSVSSFSFNHPPVDSVAGGPSGANGASKIHSCNGWGNGVLNPQSSNLWHPTFTANGYSYDNGFIDSQPFLNQRDNHTFGGAFSIVPLSNGIQQRVPDVVVPRSNGMQQRNHDMVPLLNGMQQRNPNKMPHSNGMLQKKHDMMPLFNGVQHRYPDMAPLSNGMQQRNPDKMQLSNGMLQRKPDMVPLSTGMQQRSSDKMPLSNVMEQRNPDIVPLSNGMQQRNSDMVPLSNGVQQRNSGMVPLSNGMQQRNSDMVPLSNGVQQRNSGMVPLSNGMQQRNSDMVPLSNGIQQRNSDMVPLSNEMYQRNPDKMPLSNGMQQRHSDMVPLSNGMQQRNPDKMPLSNGMPQRSPDSDFMNGFLGDNGSNITGFSVDERRVRWFNALRWRVLLLAKDQHECRTLQETLKMLTNKEFDIIFLELINHVAELMVDPFANYVVQRMVEICSEEQRTRVVLMVTQFDFQLLRICLSSHGTRAVEKLLEHVTTQEQRVRLISALTPGAAVLAKDVNGHRVLLHCLKHFSGEENKYLLNVVINKCVGIATDKTGCCVLQQCINYARGGAKRNLIASIIVNASILAEDCYGNYVVQHLLSLKMQAVVEELLRLLEGKFFYLACNKYGSNVVERFFHDSSELHSTAVILELLYNPNVAMLLVDPYGNYVIRSALSVAKGVVRNALERLIKLNALMMQSNLFGKKLLAWFEKGKI